MKNRVIKEYINNNNHLSMINSLKDNISFSYFRYYLTKINRWFMYILIAFISFKMYKRNEDWVNRFRNDSG